MKHPGLSLTHQVILIIIYYLSGIISIKLGDSVSQIPVVWFPAGVATAVFLCSRRCQWPVLLVCFILINLLFDNSLQEHFILSLIYATLSMSLVMIIPWIVRRFSRPDDNLHVVVIWVFSTIICSLLDALFFSAGFTLLNQGTFKEIFWTGFIADVTGILFATTVIIGFFNTQFSTNISFVKNKISGAIVWLILILFTLLIFNNSLKGFIENTLHINNDALIFAFACQPIILAVVLYILWGNKGGSVALLTLATIVIYFTDQGLGPFFLKGLLYGEPLLLVQCYLTATALLMVFLRVLTRNLRRFNEINNGHHAIYQLNLNTGEIDWSNISGELANFDPTPLSRVDGLLEQLHPEDKEKLLTHWDGTIKSPYLPLLSFRICNSGGDWITITDSESILFNQHEPRMIIGTWCITNHMNHVKKD
ncbi:TPA: MASE1 domain-containing protein [Yersinia enterocolitica]|nr:MASE1 domain-containing protein [Yersinia enterocolitica]